MYSYLMNYSIFTWPESLITVKGHNITISYKKEHFYHLPGFYCVIKNATLLWHECEIFFGYMKNIFIFAWEFKKNSMKFFPYEETWKNSIFRVNKRKFSFSSARIKPHIFVVDFADVVTFLYTTWLRVGEALHWKLRVHNFFFWLSYHILRGTIECTVAPVESTLQYI